MSVKKLLSATREKTLPPAEVHSVGLRIVDHDLQAHPTARAEELGREVGEVGVKSQLFNRAGSEFWAIGNWNRALSAGITGAGRIRVPSKNF